MANTDYNLFEFISIVDQMRDNYNHHGTRVAEYTVKLAEAMGIADLEIIKAGAHLHDVGKLLVPREILNAPRKLSAYERSLVEGHSRLGWAIVKQANYHAIIQGMALCHHEKWDGTGYPDKLSHNQIPLAARILSIADVYDALTNQRSYRNRHTHQFTKEYMLSLKGRDFEPDLVDVFFEKVIPQESEEGVQPT